MTMADPLDEYLTTPLPHTTLTGRPVRISEPHIGTHDAATPSEAATRSRLRDWGVPQRVADWIGSWAPWTPPGAGYDAGSVIGAGMAADNPGQVGLGVGLTALAALPLGIRARPPAAPAASREASSILSQYGSRQPPPITGHNIGSLQMPRVPRQVDPELGLYSAADEAGHSYPRTAGTARDIQDWMHSQGVTANEMAARGLTGLFSDPRRTITRQELLGHLIENPIRLEAARYQGSMPEPDLRSMSRARMRGDDGEVTEHIIEDRNTGRQFTIVEDHDAGNVAVRTESGAWLEVPGRMNNQNYDHGIQAIGNYLERQAQSPGARGPARFGPHDYSDLSLNAAGNPTYQENILHMGPSRRAQEIETQYRGNHAEVVALSDKPDRTPAEADRLIRLNVANKKLREELNGINSGRFVDSHYPDQPNPIGWIRSSTQEAFERGPGGDANLARPPLRGVLWDELQMPMAQRIRDEGARNETRVAELQGRMPALNDELHAAQQAAQEFFAQHGVPTGLPDLVHNANATYLTGATPEIRRQSFVLGNRLRNAETARDLAERELATATRAISGNPFVNDTNQAIRTLMHFGLQDPRFRDPNIGGVFLTPAQLQIERYNLARVVPMIEVEASANAHGGAGQRFAYLYDNRRQGELVGRLDIRPDGTVTNVEGARQLGVARGRPLSEVVGPDVAREIMATQPARLDLDPSARLRRIYTNDIEIGGRGMRENYGRIYPETLDAILRRLDPAYPGRRQVVLSTRPHAEQGTPLPWTEAGPPPPGRTPGYVGYLEQPVHYFPFTERIRRQIERGLPYFGGAVAVPTLMQGARDPLEEYSAPPRRP
jgi:hypothetical protein